jgi:ATP/ADP translocase
MIMFTVISCPVFLFAVGSYAYVGPGLGLSAIVAFFGVIFAVLMAMLGIIWYPFKRMIKKIKAHRNSNNSNER